MAIINTKACIAAAMAGWYRERKPHAGESLEKLQMWQRRRTMKASSRGASGHHPQLKCL